MAGSVWFDAVDTFKEYGMESKVILDDLIRAMEVREAETNICYLAQSYDISLEECEKVEGGKYYVEPEEEDDY